MERAAILEADVRAQKAALRHTGYLKRLPIPEARVDVGEMCVNGCFHFWREKPEVTDAQFIYLFPILLGGKNGCFLCEYPNK
jgi:hypothetical protein